MGIGLQVALGHGPVEEGIQAPVAVVAVAGFQRASWSAMNPWMGLALGGEVLAFEAGCEEDCECEVDGVELQGGQVYLHLGPAGDEPPRR